MARGDQFMLTKDSPGAARLLDLMMLRNNKRSIVSGPVLTPLTSATLNNWMAHSCNFQDQNIIRIQKVLKVALQEIFHQIIRAIDRVIMYRQRAQRDSLLCGFLYDFVNQIFELPFLIVFLFRPQPLTWSMNFEGYRSLRGKGEQLCYTQVVTDGDSPPYWITLMLGGPARHYKRI